MLGDLATATTLSTFSPGRISMADEKELPADNERMSLVDVAKLIECSDTVLKVAARSGLLPTAKKYGNSWTVEYGAARDWYNREKHPGGRPKKTNI